MLSKKCDKYMQQYGDRNYASKKRKLEKNDLKQYTYRNGAWKTAETSSCDCFTESGSQKEIKLIYRSINQNLTNNLTLEDAWLIGGQNEEFREEKPVETYQERQSRIPQSTKRRSKIEKTNHEIQAGEKEMKEKLTKKEKKHEAKESKAHEKKEDKKQSKRKK